MYDGRIVPVQDIREGDVLMGDDSLPRKVGLCVTGSAPLYKISAEGFDDYIANANHILSLVYLGPPRTHTIHEDYLEVNDKIDISLHDYSNLPDTIQRHLCAYRPIIDFLARYTTSDAYFVGQRVANGDIARIPENYLINDQGTRSSLLAGLRSSSRKIIMNDGLRRDLCFLVNSLGYAYCFDPDNGTQFYKRMFRTLCITQIPSDEYFGFELDGNGRFLLGDFTVTHNTSGMRDEVDKYRFANKGCCIVKYASDKRYAGDGLIAHDGKEYQKTPIIITERLGPILDELLGYDVIGIDEMQFFPDCVEVAQQLANNGKIVICSGLDGDFRAKPFGRVAEMIAIAEDVIKLTAVCVKCCKDASFTYKFASDDQIVDIGGADKYIPLCRSCRWPAPDSI